MTVKTERTWKKPKQINDEQQIRRPKIICSPSYGDFRSRANAAVLLDLFHKKRGEHIREVWA
jgi:hypothetical protein